ncbi:MAG TPA: DUF4234 domain-containing protein [Candidatus Acidoferrales bacterium]|nr:DUF4234 domain-containing protein [Candidatus Acidoferrales bacterium]
MATDVTIAGQTYRKRNIFGVWLGLPIITLGIYHYVWWYKINDEARRFLGDESIRPGVAVLALFPGSILIIPPFISIYRTAERVRRMQQQAGVGNVVTPWIALVLSFVFGLHSLYLQMGLNDVWDRYLGPGGMMQAAPPPAAPHPGLPPQP